MKARIQVEEVATCPICGSEDEPFYHELDDQNYGTPGLWGFYRCPKHNLLWLSPRPVAKDIGKVYPTCYGTHAITQEGTLERLRRKAWFAVIATSFGYGEFTKASSWRAIGWLLGAVPVLRDMARGQVMWLHGHSRGRLLDIGCGNGHFLAVMRHLGWEIVGCDLDPEAAKLARTNLQAPIFAGTLTEAGYPNDSFDAITLSHVIEHVYDPIELLAECRRVLMPGGQLVVVTPNVGSLGHKVFHKAWSLLDPPRHLFLFSPQALRDCASATGLQITRLWTTPRLAYWWWATSRLRRHTEIFDGGTANRWLLAWSVFFQVVESALHLFGKGLGEEIVLIATKA